MSPPTEVPTLPYRARTSTAASAAGVFDQWRYAYPENPPPPRAAWFHQTPSAFVGAWECLAFRKRSGLAWTDEADRYAEEFGDEALARIAAMGCNHLVLSHAKGYGRVSIGAETEILQDVIDRAQRKHGLRVGLYIRLDSVIPELLRHEYGDVDEWLTRSHFGRPSYYSAGQTFRSRICHLHPSAMQYIEAELRHAIIESRADLIHLDGLHFSFYPSETCRCERCLATYRLWLAHTYPQQAQRDAFFGPVDFDTIGMPSFDPLQQAMDPGFAPFQGLSDTIASPDIQSWYRYRWDGELALVRHIRRLIHMLNPEVAVTMNPAWGSCYNSYRVYTTWAERMLPWADALWSEDPLHLKYEPDHLVSRVGTFKLAREYGTAICAYHWMKEPGRIEASLALTGAANGGHLACQGFTIRHLPHYTLGEKIKAKVTAWTKKHWQLFENTTPGADIAMLRHQPSLAWNSRQPWWSAMSCEQLLVHIQIPWRMFDRIDPDRLATIRTLLLPDCTCLSDDEVETLKAWVADGGRLFITARTASHDENHRRRPLNPFAELIPAWRSALEPAAEQWFTWIQDQASIGTDVAAIQPCIVNIEKGFIGFWPVIQNHDNHSLAYGTLEPDDWRLPGSAQEMMAFIRALHGKCRIQLDAPPSVMIEHHLRADGADLIHLVNVAETVNDVDVHISGPLIGQRAIRLHSLDEPLPRIDDCNDGIRLHGVGRYVIIELSEKLSV